MFKTRLLSGIVLVILALFLIISGHEILLFATLAISCIGMFELYRVFKMEKTVLAGVGYLAAIVYYCNLQWKFLPDLMILFMAFLILLMFVFVFAYPKFHADQVMAAFFGFFYVAVMLSYVYQIRTLERGLYLAFLVFLCSWGCDTCAYCVGMLIGKHNYGHTVGAKNVETVCQAADELGIEYLTLYAFSTENWNRPDSEVAALMKLLESYLKNCIRTANKNNMRVRVIGELSRLSESFQKKIQELEEVSAANTGLNLTIAINYGSRDEMLRAMKHMFTDIKNGRIAEEEINEKIFSGYLDTRELPDPDLLIRTSGEQRLSNYLLWQLAYSEFYFTDVPWPDFHKKELELAVEAYNKRDRRFGGLKEEE